MEIYYTGVIIAVSTFLIIGLFHPIVIKVEYHTGTRYWWVFLVAGIISVGAASWLQMFSTLPFSVCWVLPVSGASGNSSNRKNAARRMVP